MFSPKCFLEQADMIKGLLPGVVHGGVIILQYADDTILFLQKMSKWPKTSNGCLPALNSGMRINSHKSDLPPINFSDDEANIFAQVFCCKIGQFPFKYLGVPLHYAKLQPVIDTIMKGIAGWRGKLLSYRGKLTLLQACIASIPLYLLSVIKFPKWAINMINSQMAHFF
jgi:hypothetical protein